MTSVGATVVLSVGEMPIGMEAKRFLHGYYPWRPVSCKA